MSVIEVDESKNGMGMDRNEWRGIIDGNGNGNEGCG